MTVVVDRQLTVEDVVNVARGREKVQLSAGAGERLKKCRSFLESRLQAGEVMYGTNTGIGEFSEIVLSDEQIRQFQKYLVYNHSAGIGEAIPEERVRAAMLSRINVHAQGYSACRPAVTEMLVECLNRGLTPVVCAKGSVGACGDLAPMAQLTLAMLGTGEAFYNGKRMAAADALKACGLKPLELEARDGLASINGSNFIAGISALLIYDIERWLKQAEIAAAMTLEALMANLRPYDARLHQLRGFQGAVTSAQNIRKVIEGSDLLAGKTKTKVQDAYSMRSTPQVIGAARDQLRWARSQLEIELNGVCDNPLFLADDQVVLTGANFQGTPVSLPIDVTGAALTMVSVLSERRLNRLLNPVLSTGLPAFLSQSPGFYSGLMLSQYTADSLIVEQRLLSAPAYVQSIPAAADQEDFVSMGMNTVLKTSQILENGYGVLGIEFIAAAQALDFRDYQPGKGTAAAKSAVRKVVEHLGEDRPLFPDHNNMSDAVKRLDILRATEEVVGELTAY